MKIGFRDYGVSGDPVSRQVELTVKVAGMCVAAEVVKPLEARELARQLLAAADRAEGKAP